MEDSDTDDCDISHHINSVKETNSCDNNSSSSSNNSNMKNSNSSRTAEDNNTSIQQLVSSNSEAISNFPETVVNIANGKSGKRVQICQRPPQSFPGTVMQSLKNLLFFVIFIFLATKTKRNVVAESRSSSTLAKPSKSTVSRYLCTVEEKKQ